MNNWKKGIITIDSDLMIYKGYTVDLFKKSKYYDKQDFDRFFVLKNSHSIRCHDYLIGLYFKNGVIKNISLMCVNDKFIENDEWKRKQYHDCILKHRLIFLKKQTPYKSGKTYNWGKISSELDPKGWSSFILFDYN